MCVIWYSHVCFCFFLHRNVCMHDIFFFHITCFFPAHGVCVNGTIFWHQEESLQDFFFKNTSTPSKAKWSASQVPAFVSAFKGFRVAHRQTHHKFGIYRADTWCRYERMTGRFEKLCKLDCHLCSFVFI